MTAKISCGTQLMHLLAAHGVDTIFGMPGVHTLEAYRGIEAAGIRHIGVQGATRKGFQASSIVMELELAPCKRYYINTQFASATTPDWQPVVDKVETVPGCKVPTATK